MVKTRSTDYDMAEAKEMFEMLMGKLSQEEERQAQEKKDRLRENEEEKERRAQERQDRLREKEEEKKRRAQEKQDRLREKEEEKERFEQLIQMMTVSQGTLMQKIDSVEEQAKQEAKELAQRIDGLEERIEAGMKIRYNTSTVSNSTNTVKPPTFDGENSWDLYKRQFEIAASNNDWTEQEKVTHLVMALRGKALDVLQNISEVNQNNYSSVVAALELRFGQSHLVQVYKTQLKCRTQLPTETLQEFGAEVERMTRLAYPHAPEYIVQELAVTTFQDGLRNPEAQLFLKTTRTRDLADAILRALEYEAAGYHSRRDRVREVKFSVPSSDQDEDLDNRKTLREIVEKLKNLPSLSRPFNREIKCYS